MFCKKRYIFVPLKAKFKIFLSFTLLAVILFAAVPKVYIHNLLGHTHDAVNSLSSGFSFNDDQNTKDCNFEKFDTPVYYTVFKFILNFLPLKERKQTSFYYKEEHLKQLPYNTSLLRGPPMA